MQCEISILGGIKRFVAVLLNGRIQTKSVIKKASFRLKPLSCKKIH